MQPANYCDMYPVTSYVLEVEGPTSCSDIIQSPSNDTLSVNNLLDNQAYSFIVVVSNSVGNVSTGKRIICESLISYIYYCSMSLLVLMYVLLQILLMCRPLKHYHHKKIRAFYCNVISWLAQMLEDVW